MLSASQERHKDQNIGPEDIHALRVQGKSLRYTLELAEPVGYTIPTPLLRSFKQLQDALGLWNDYVVLGQSALEAALEEKLPRKDSRLYGQILDLARICHRASEHHLRQFMKLWDKSGQDILQQVTQVFRPGGLPLQAEPESTSKEHTSSELESLAAN